MNFKIEDDVPLPAPSLKRFPHDFKKMRIGQSIVVRNVELGGARYAAKVQKVRIVTRREDDAHMRIWRAEA